METGRDFEAQGARARSSDQGAGGERIDGIDLWMLRRARQLRPSKLTSRLSRCSASSHIKSYEVE